ncbi:MAG TPA: protein kinase [Solirubrobacteraceae bacterium]|nr:protein kinase [Solirubrobacteraceae bacterium]
MLAGAELDGRILDGRYELRGVIGEGSFGRVYRGHDRRLARPVAVKVIKPWWAEDGASIERFQHEARLLARVNDPGIVQIYDFGHTPTGPYYVAELVEGESLEERLRGGPVPVAEAVRIAEQLCAALGSAHAEGVVHCDVKPANVLLDQRGRVKVGDFGVARFGETTSDESSALFGGTPRYMSPEQARGRRLTPASDVYSAGVVLYEMLAGKPPFQAGSAVELGISHLQEAPPELPATVPPALREVVAVAMAKRPGERYRDGAVMAAALRAAKDSMHDPGASTAQLALPPRESPAVEERGATPAATVKQAPLRRREEGEARKSSPAIESTPVADAVAAPARGREGASAGATVAMPRKTPSGKRVRRRRRGPWLALAVVLAGAGAGAYLLLRGTARTTVPRLQGLHRPSVLERTGRTHVHAVFASHYSHAPVGVAVAQIPRAGTRVREGSDVRVLMSAGPPPVAVPNAVGEPAAEAEAAIAGAGLRYALRTAPAAGHAPESVLSESPSADTSVPSGSTVTLTVVASPQWRALTSFSGIDDGQSVPFRIRGHRWRLSYTMSYRHTCLFLVVCQGPSASVEELPGSSSFGEFELDEGSGTHYHVYDGGPGLYRVTVTGGHDPARWSATVEDFY